jgi:hypothetical protein
VKQNETLPMSRLITEMEKTDGVIDNEFENPTIVSGA